MRGLSRETDLVLDRAGRWRSDGHLLTHPGVVAAFSRWIERATDGRYVLRNDLHYVYVTVEGAPLHARALERDGDDLTLILQGGEREPLRVETLRAGADDTLYASARDGSWTVRLDPSAALALEPYLREDPAGVAIVVAGARHVIPVREDPLT